MSTRAHNPIRPDRPAGQREDQFLLHLASSAARSSRTCPHMQTPLPLGRGRSEGPGEGLPRNNSGTCVPSSSGTPLGGAELDRTINLSHSKEHHASPNDGEAWHPEQDQETRCRDEVELIQAPLPLGRGRSEGPGEGTSWQGVLQQGLQWLVLFGLSAAAAMLAARLNAGN